MSVNQDYRLGFSYIGMAFPNSIYYAIFINKGSFYDLSEQIRLEF